jgi:uncharacterized protein YjbI with pentapeptide repeats
MGKPVKFFNRISAIVSEVFSNPTSSSVVVTTPTGVIGIRRGADLSYQDLSGVIIPNADLSSVDLRGANLYSADLRGVTLTSANLSGANLEGANLEGANLSNAVLDGANLASANLKNTTLWGADLSRVVGQYIDGNSGSVMS